MSSKEPDWDKIPTDEEIMLARSVLMRMSRALPFSDPDYAEVWGGLVEARRMLTVSVSLLSSFRGHYRHYNHLWLMMLAQDN